MKANQIKIYRSRVILYGVLSVAIIVMLLTGSVLGSKENNVIVVIFFFLSLILTALQIYLIASN